MRPGSALPHTGPVSQLLVPLHQDTHSTSFLSSSSPAPQLNSAGPTFQGSGRALAAWCEGGRPVCASSILATIPCLCLTPHLGLSLPTELILPMASGPSEGPQHHAGSTWRDSGHLHLSCITASVSLTVKQVQCLGDTVGGSKAFTLHLALQGHRLVPFPHWDRGPTIKVGRQAGKQEGRVSGA